MEQPNMNPEEDEELGFNVDDEKLAPWEELGVNVDDEPPFVQRMFTSIYSEFRYRGPSMTIDDQKKLILQGAPEREDDYVRLNRDGRPLEEVFLLLIPSTGGTMHLRIDPMSSTARYSVELACKKKDEMDSEKDTDRALEFIENHELKDEIITLFRNGVSDTTGWMFTQNETPEFKVIQSKVLEMNYDSSGFGFMMRQIEHRLNEDKAAQRGIADIHRYSPGTNLTNFWPKPEDHM